MINLRLNAYALVFAVTTIATTSAHASVNLTASFLELTATVNANDSIKIWLRISAQPDSDPFYYDPTQSPDSQIPTQYLPAYGLTGNGNKTKPFATFEELSRTTITRCNPAASCFAISGMYTQQSGCLYETTGLAIAPGTYVIEGTGIGLTAGSDDQKASKVTS